MREYPPLEFELYYCFDFIVVVYHGVHMDPNIYHVNFCCSAIPSVQHNSMTTMYYALYMTHFSLDLFRIMAKKLCNTSLTCAKKRKSATMLFTLQKENEPSPEAHSEFQTTQGDNCRNGGVDHWTRTRDCTRKCNRWPVVTHENLPDVATN